MSDIPEQILVKIQKAKEKEFTDLDLSRNQLTELPESLGELQGLNHLYLNRNQLTKLPEWMGQLKGLKELGLSNNKLTQLPQSMGQLKGLTSLNLNDNKLTELPQSIGQLQVLTHLFLSHNQLTELPQSVGQLRRLIRLDLSDNKLTELPESIGQLESLIQLRGDHNQLIDLPESMRHLQELTHLLLRNNQLIQLPKWIWQLMKLTQLDWRNNPIKNLPPEMPGVLYSDDIKKYRAYFCPEVYISYAWGGESEEIANELDKAFQEKGITIIQDKRDLEFKERIKEFMEQIGRGRCVIVVISKKYLESKDCMFELVEIAKNGDFYDRIFPIVLNDAKIYKAIDRIKYIKHWEEQIKELEEALKEVGQANLPSLRKDIDLYTRIRHTIDGLMDTLRDMNTLTADMHRASGFAELIKAVERKLAE